MALQRYEDALAEYERERSDPGWAPVHLGFGSVDAEIRGVSAGQVLGIAARTAVGKTWLLETIQHNFAARTDAGQVSLSLEMPGPEWFERSLAIHENVSPEQVEGWARGHELGEHVQGFLRRMKHSLLSEASCRIEALPALVQEARTMLEVPLRLLLIDYQGMIRAGGDSYERASKVALAIKDLAKSERISVVMATQLSRAGGDGSTPVSLEMLRDSGVLEESVDFLLGCWRPAGEDNEDTMTVAILKNRKGKQGKWVDLEFRKHSRRLYEPASPFSL